MKKVPSYPKITTKTNITFTQTQNININSPKSIGFSPNSLATKKLFKSASDNINTFENKLNRQREKSNNSHLTMAKNVSSTNEKSSQKILAHKASRSTKELTIKKQASTGNLKVNNKNHDPQVSMKNEQFAKVTKPQGKQQIKKLQQKLKLLQKKIDTLKTSSSKRKVQSSASHRSNSKVKEHSMSKIGQISQVMDSFKRKKLMSNEGSTSTSKMLKKSYSDKNMLRGRPPKMPKRAEKGRESQGVREPEHQQDQHQQQPQNHFQQQKNQHSPPQHQQQVIHKFVTQVQKNPKMFQRHHHPDSLHHQKTHYYITNLSLSLKNTDFMIYREHLIQSLQTFSFMQNVRRPSLKQLQKHSVTLYHHEPKKWEDKYTIVLDLDETLIHCNETLETPYDVSLKIKFPTGEKIDAGVNIRPHAHKLLKELSQFCQIIVFTASHQCYANVVLDHLDPEKQFISHRLFRSHCWQTEEGIYIKDLRILKNRDLETVLLVDNAAYSYYFQLQNGIPIIPFYDDKEDEELLHLIGYIKTLIKYKDTQKVYNTIRKANDSYFRLTEYKKFNNLEKLAKMLYEPVVKEFEAYIE